MLGGLLVLAACKPNPGTSARKPALKVSTAPLVPAPPGTPGLPPTGPELLTGAVTLPSRILSNNGGNVISNNGGRIIGNNGAGIISNNGGSLVSIVRVPIISDQGGAYALLAAAGPSAGLRQALVYLTDRDEKHFLNALTDQPFAVLSDDQGRYRFAAEPAAGFPLDQDVVVNAVANGNIRLVGYVRPAAGGAGLELDLASTLATELLRGHAYRAGRKLASYDAAVLQAAIDGTREAIGSGAIAALAPRLDEAGQPVPDDLVGTFDLRIDHVEDLRNQYAVAMSAVEPGNTLLRGVSDAWKQLLGERPSVVTTLLGKRDNRLPTVTAGGVQGEVLGNVSGIAVSRRGDVFMGGSTNVVDSGHIRWLKPDGSVSALVTPDLKLGAPGAIVIEREPGDGQGWLLVADRKSSRVWRLAISDEASAPAPQLVAGGFLPRRGYDPADSFGPKFDPSADYDHPFFVEGPATFPKVSSARPATSRWRLAEEGERRYLVGNQGNNRWPADRQHAAGERVPQPARYASLYGPYGLALDEQGNLYISDTNNHRIRMIPKVAGHYFGYRRPLDDDGDGAPDRFGEPVTMQPDCIYTIAGNPGWDTLRTADNGASRWFGEYAGSDGKPAQEAHLDTPMGLAWHDGALYVLDGQNERLRRIDRAGGRIETVAGNPPEPQNDDGGGSRYYYGAIDGDGGPAREARLWGPTDLAIDAAGRIFFGDTLGGRIRLIDLDGRISTIAGHVGEQGAATTSHTADGEARRWADLHQTRGLALDAQGNLLFMDGQYRRLRKLWRQWE